MITYKRKCRPLKLCISIFNPGKQFPYWGLFFILSLMNLLKKKMNEIRDTTIMVSTLNNAGVSALSIEPFSGKINPSNIRRVKNITAFEIPFR
jgi:hypothetical protein